MKKILRLSILTLAIFSIAGSSAYISSPVNAVTAASWKAGNIIDDSVFTDTRSMSVSQIQSWLNSRLKNCDYYGTQVSELGGGTDYNKDGVVTRAEYGRTRGNPAPFTCLNKYYEVPKTSPSSTIPKSNYGSSTIPSGAKSAAQLIYDAAQAYDISPRVLLVKLGTESAGPLTSDTWPFKKQYLYAMGAHCPDSGPGGTANCDSNYAGFSIQIREAAALLRWYLDSMDESWWSYKKPYQTNYILWNVQQSGCSGANVYIENKATAALYTYTPYQPNSAALKNMYGTGNSCSAYGNRNFWRVYNDWFGSTWGSPFVSYNGKVYAEGAANTYYHVLNPETLRAYGYGTAFKTIRAVSSSFFSDKTNRGTLPLVVRFEGDAIYSVASGSLSQFGNRTMYEDNYGFTVGQEANLSQSWLARFKKLGQMAAVLKLSDGNPVYYVTGGEKSHITSPSAFTTLGSPPYSSQPAIALNSLFANSLPSGPPILTANTIIKATDTNRIYFWDGTTSTNVLGSAGAALQGKVSYGAPSSQILQLPAGPAVDKYVKSSAGQAYILHYALKIPLADADLAELSVNKSTLPVGSDQMLGLFATKAYDTVSLVRFEGEDKVYRQVSSKDLYSVVDRYDFNKYGLSMSSVVSLPAEVQGLINDLGYQFSQKRLIQVIGQSPIYISDVGTKKLYHVPSRELAKQYGIDLVNIAAIPGLSSAPSYSTSSLGRIVKDDSDTLWLIDHRIRYQVPPSLLPSFGYSGGTTFNALPASLLSSYPSRGQLTQYLRDYSTGAIYKIVDGKKHWFSSRQKFEQATSWSNIRDVSPEYLKTVPSGSSI